MSVIVLLIALFLILSAAIVVIVILFLVYTQQLEKQKEKDTLKIVSLEAELKVNQQKLTTTRQSDRFDELSGSIVRDSHTGIIIFDHLGVVLLFNPFVQHLTGAFEQDVIQKRYTDVLNITNQEGAKEHGAIEEALLGRTAVLPKWTFIASRNGKTPIFGSATPIKLPDGNNGSALIFQDATGDYDKEEEDKAFFSAAAHELRSPLTTIRDVVSLLLKDFDTVPKDKMKEMLTGAHQYIIKLIDIVNDFLNVSRIEQHRMQLFKEPFDIIALTKEVIIKHELVAKERHLYIHHELGQVHLPKVYGDRDKTAEILTNLLINAVKYTHEGGATISHGTENSHVTTLVTDTGVGINSDYHRLLFHKFQRVDSSRNLAATKSTGLGLYISKKLAILMGGDLTLFSSQPGQGSTFKLTLPVAPHNGSDQSASHEPQQQP